MLQPSLIRLESALNLTAIIQPALRASKRHAQKMHITHSTSAVFTQTQDKVCVQMKFSAGCTTSPISAPAGIFRDNPLICAASCSLSLSTVHKLKLSTSLLQGGAAMARHVRRLMNVLKGHQAVTTLASICLARISAHVMRASIW